MTQSPDFKKFLNSAQAPQGYKTTLVPGLKTEVQETLFSPLGENMWSFVSELSFTHPDYDVANRAKMLDQYRLFINELFLTVEVKATEFSNNGIKANIDERRLEGGKKDCIALIEAIISGDARFTPYLNPSEPEDGWGKRFCFFKMVFLLVRSTDSVSYDLIVGQAVHAHERSADGGSVFIKAIYDSLLGVD